jgi:GT2 family glycosyltransferase
MGTIIVPNPGMLRHIEFVRDLFRLDKPAGTEVVFPSSGSVVKNLNNAVRELHGEWAWLQSDDHRFGPDLLNRLLAHEADIVVPLVVKRSPPYGLVVGSETTVTDELSGRTYPAFVPLDQDALAGSPFSVEMAGTAGMLIRRRVFDALGFPYFESTDGLYTNEDIEFCRRARAKGFEILCDPNARLGHIVSTPVWPL